jgi:hypothetical protein
VADHCQFIGKMLAFEEGSSFCVSMRSRVK